MLFKKKEDNAGKLPDLPPAPNSRINMPPIRPLNEKREAMPEVPPVKPYPAQKIKEGFQPSIKPNLPPLPEFKDDRPISEVGKIPNFPEKPEPEVILAQVSLPSSYEQEPKTKGPIFIKLEKFKSAKNSIDKIQEKLEEIDELLKKTREIRTKEEQELSYWEKEVQDLKLRLERVNNSIFEKVE